MNLVAQQLYAAVCGNGHIITDTMVAPVLPGTTGVPKLCTSCSAPVFTRCTNEGCDAPINGDLDPGYVRSRTRRTDWFCRGCDRPYVWAKPEQIRAWVSNRLQFDTTLDEDTQFELIETLAVLTQGEAPANGATFETFRATLKSVPALYNDLKPFLPALIQLFHTAK